MKYIILKTQQGAYLPILFPDCLTHCFVAGAMQLAVDTLDPQKDLRPRQLDDMLEHGSAKPVSAGFVALPEAVVRGKSESLNDLAAGIADEARIVLGDSVMFMPDDAAIRMLDLWRTKRDG